MKFGKWPLIVAEARRGNTLLLPSTVIVEMFGSVLERALISGEAEVEISDGWMSESYGAIEYSNYAGYS